MQGLRAKQDMQQNAGSTKNITVALGVLDQVRKGKLNPAKAAKLMQGLTAGDQARLADLVVGRNNREGKTNMNELKALQALQRLPAPSDVEPHDILSNFTRDVSGLVTGLPAGIGMTLAYAGKDTANALIPGHKPTSNLYDKIIKPIGHQYADTYSPLVHGDLGGFYKKFHEHPAGPILDALSIFSAGAGTVSRVGRAGEAIGRAEASSLASVVPKRGIPITSRLKGDYHVAPGNAQEIFDAAGEPGWPNTSADLLNFVADNAHHGDKAITLKDANGEIHAAMSYDDTGSHIKGYGLAAKTPGAGAHLMQQFAAEVAKQGKSLRFEADPQAVRYYDRLGMRKVKEADAEGYGTTYELTPEEAKKFAQSDIVVPSRQMVPGPGLTTAQKARVAVPAFLKAGGQGGLVDLYDRKKGITHEAEIQDTMKQVQQVLDDPSLRLDRRQFKEVISDVANDIRATRTAGKARPAEMAAGLPGFISAGSTGRALSAGETALREASDIVRAGAIYLRPAYLPNNWAGNTFMNVVHQGVLAPVNLAKSLVLDKNIGVRYTRAMDKAMGANPASVVTSGTGRGYVASLTQPAAHIMGAAADQPFRRAAFLHEARRAGYSKLSQVKDLFDKAAGGDEASLRQIAEISRKGQEEIVKFGHMNEAERSLIRNLVFVYSWMRGAGRYASRFPLQHPIQTDAFNAVSGPGNDYTASIMGGVPSFMAGVVPIGRGKDGNPIVINPFSLNPLGTGLQLIRAAAGTLDVIRDPKSFNKYAQDDVVGLLNPILGAYITAREGGPSMKKQLENTIAAMALVKGLKHPGYGSIYPTTRAEAVGHFTLGALYPREADAAAVKKSLERQNVGNPIAMIPQEIDDFQKATGKEPPYSLVIAYRKDLEDLQIQKDFQSHYADSHGASGFRNMPAQNRLEAGIDFLRKYGKIKSATVDEIERTSKNLTTDEEYNSYANAVWNLTGVGQWKDAWNNMMRQVTNKELTRKRG